MFDDFTSPDDNLSSRVTEAYWTRLTQMQPAERLERCLNLCKATRQLAIAGIRQRYPEIADDELRIRFAALALGRDFSVKHFGWDPEIQGY